MGKRFTPPWLDKVRFLAAYYVSGCEAPWGLYAEKALPQAKETIVILTALSAADIVREFFRPQGLRSKRHGRKGSKSRGQSYGIPGPDELVARTLRADLDFKGVTYSVPAGVFYVFTDVVDRLVYTAMIVELSTDLVYESVLGVLEVDKTFCPHLGRAWCEGGFMLEGGPGSGWQALSQGEKKYAVKVQIVNKFSFHVPPGTWSITMGLKFGIPSIRTRVRFRLFDQLKLPEVTAETEWFDLELEQARDAIVNAVVEGPATMAFQYQDEGGFWRVIRNDLMILEII